MSNRHYRTPAHEPVADTLDFMAALAGPPPRDARRAPPQGKPDPLEEFEQDLQARFSPHEIEGLRKRMARRGPLRELVAERRRAHYLELGGADVDNALEGIRAIISLGHKTLGREAEGRPPVTAGEFVRAVAELRRCLEMRERLMRQALERAAYELREAKRDLQDLACAAAPDAEAAPTPEAPRPATAGLRPSARPQPPPDTLAA